MSFPKAEKFELGRLNGTVYTFEPGNELPLHSHEAGASHITFVLTGQITVFTTETSENFGPGSFLVFDPGQLHGFCTSEQATIIQLIY